MGIVTLKQLLQPQNYRKILMTVAYENRRNQLQTRFREELISLEPQEYLHSQQHDISLVLPRHERPTISAPILLRKTRQSPQNKEIPTPEPSQLIREEHGPAGALTAPKDQERGPTLRGKY